jgi:glucose-6-phosphate isomerase
MLHQGTQEIPADFIGCCQSHHELGGHHEILMSNFFAQTEALMRGKTAEEATEDMLAQNTKQAEIDALLPHRVFPGNRPSSSILLKKLDPHALGLLLALYEHKVFVQSVIWRINAFDQWGVELGKRLADRILPELTTSTLVATHDASTNGLINHYKSNR